jgi:hypothetical protein
MLKMTHKHNLGVQTESFEEVLDGETFESHRYSGAGK